MKLILYWSVIAIVVVIMVINALFMLASPRAWFRLPRWIRAQGTLAENEHTSGWGSITLRLTGAVILVTIAWVLYETFSRGRYIP
jgi:hypothetical protein